MKDNRVVVAKVKRGTDGGLVTPELVLASWQDGCSCVIVLRIQEAPKDFIANNLVPNVLF